MAGTAKGDAPTVKRAAVLREPAIAAGIGQWAVVQAAASALGGDLRSVDVRDPDEIERGVLLSRAHRTAVLSRGELLGTSIADRSSRVLPASIARVYPYRRFVAAGGLIPTAPIFSTNTG